MVFKLFMNFLYLLIKRNSGPFLFDKLKKNHYLFMSPIFKCLICRQDIERSTKTFWSKKGHLLCSTCLDNIDKNKL